MRDELRFDFILYENIIGCDAGLARIEEFSPSDSFCRKFNRRALVDDARIFSAQF